MLVKSKVKYIQSLSHKKQREEDGVFIAEGPKIINELLNDISIELVELFALKEWVQQNNNAAPVTEIEPTELERMSTLSAPNQVLGIFRIPATGTFDPTDKVSLLLSNIQDPGNLGTIIRCADWFGVEQVVCSKDCVDVYNPKTIQSTMGSIARVKIFYKDLLEVVNAHADVPLYAATLNGTDVNKMGSLKEGMILIGNESKGISNDLLSVPHHKITIPKKGKAESLNAAMATAVLLHALT